jgi:hypothetical protein
MVVASFALSVISYQLSVNGYREIARLRGSLAKYRVNNRALQVRHSNVNSMHRTIFFTAALKRVARHWFGKRRACPTNPATRTMLAG